MAACFFRYDERWVDIAPRFVAAVVDKDADELKALARILEDRDVQIEDFINTRVTCDCDCEGEGPPEM